MKLLLAFLHFLGDGFVSSLAISHQASVTEVPASCVTFTDDGLVAIKNACLGHVDTARDDADSEDKSAQGLWDRATRSLLGDNPDRACEYGFDDTGAVISDVDCFSKLSEIQKLVENYAEALVTGTNSFVNNETNGEARRLERLKTRSLHWNLLDGSVHHKCHLPCADNMVLGVGFDSADPNDFSQSCNDEADCSDLTVSFLIAKMMTCKNKKWYRAAVDQCSNSDYGWYGWMCSLMIEGEVRDILHVDMHCAVECQLGGLPVTNDWDQTSSNYWYGRCHNPDNNCPQASNRRLGMEEEGSSEFRKLRPTTSPHIGRRR